MVLSILIAAIACYLLGNHNGAICVSAILGNASKIFGDINCYTYNSGRAAFQ